MTLSYRTWAILCSFWVGSYQLLSAVGSDVTELRDDLDAMNALLSMQSEAMDGTVDHFVRVRCASIAIYYCHMIGKGTPSPADSTSPHVAPDPRGALRLLNS